MQVFVDSEEEGPFALCTLNASIPQYSTHLTFADHIKISVVGEGEVHVVGTVELDPAFLDDEDDMDMDSDELLGEYPSGSSDSGDESHPAFAGTGRIQVVDEDEEDDSDSDVPAATTGSQTKALPAATGKPQQQANKPSQPQGQKPAGGAQQQGKGGNNNNKPAAPKPQQQGGAKPQQPQGGQQQGGEGKKKKRKNKNKGGPNAGPGPEKKTKQ